MGENIGILMPAYRPEPAMLAYLERLRESWKGLLLLVDDGSGSAYQGIFREAEALGAVVLRHSVNRGKGRAIKTGLSWCRENRPQLAGVVTVDCDGQHSLEDVRRVMDAMARFPEALVLGCRRFGEGTPARSLVGNRITSRAMKLLYNMELEDTQTGLRGLPACWFPELMTLGGERYEYELNMLIAAQRQSIPLEVVPIRTLYFQGNAGSHYRAVMDSLRAVRVMGWGLVQYGLSSLASALVDVSLYAVLVKWVLAALPLSEKLFLAAVIARILSSLVNYSCNRKLPYMQNRKLFPTFVRYYTLWAGQLAASFGLVWLGCRFLGMDELAAKLVADLFLAAASYQIQLRWVFRKQEEGEGLWGRKRERA